MVGNATVKSLLAPAFERAPHVVVELDERPGETVAAGLVDIDAKPQVGERVSASRMGEGHVWQVMLLGGK